MMKVLAGSMVGGLVAGTIALVASSASQSGVDAGKTTPPASMQTAAPEAWGLDNVTFTGAPANETAASPSTLVQCEPHQQALMRRAMINGREVSTISCVSTMAPMAPAAASTVAYATAAPVMAAAQPAVMRERVVEREAPRARKRSWGKTALVVGGTSGAGAGIGALIGGKKGALIGAAIGGGSGAIYEVTKRK